MCTFVFHTYFSSSPLSLRILIFHHMRKFDRLQIKFGHRPYAHMYFAGFSAVFLLYIPLFFSSRTFFSLAHTDEDSQMNRMSKDNVAAGRVMVLPNSKRQKQRNVRTFSLPLSLPCHFSSLSVFACPDPARSKTAVTRSAVGRRRLRLAGRRRRQRRIDKETKRDSGQKRDE